MSLLAEEVVQEWLCRQGYFTLRGARLGVHEIDLLAIRVSGNEIHCRHIEVQSSHNPRSYLSRVPHAVQKGTGRKATSSKWRSDDELASGIQEWVEKKFHNPRKKALRAELAPGPWTHELVLHQMHDQRERQLLLDLGIKVHALTDILRDLKSPGSVVASAGGAALVELIMATSSEIRD